MLASLSFDGVGFLAALAVAVGSSFHCAGMCGGFVLATTLRPGACALASMPRGARGVLASQVLYHLGKTMSYLFVGSLAAGLGAAVMREGSGPARVLSLAAGGFLVLVGTRTLGLLPRIGGALHRVEAAAARHGWTRLGSSLLSLQSPLLPVYLGAFSGLLPCPIVYAFAARAATASGVVDALATMAALGLGTIPVLLAVALTGSTLSPLLRARLSAASGVLLILLGAWTCWRGWAATPCCS